MIKPVARTILLWIAIASFGTRAIGAVELPASEYAIKAAFLFNFLKFVEWPPKAFPERNSPIIIGILGDDPFYDPAAKVNYLDQAVEGKMIKDKNIVVQRSERNLASLKNCQLLFVCRSERNRIKDILANLDGLHVLIVSEVDNFCEAGGAINFVMQSGKVRFEINVGAAEKAGLKISSKLLSVAKIVPTESR